MKNKRYVSLFLGTLFCLAAFGGCAAAPAEAGSPAAQASAASALLAAQDVSDEIVCVSPAEGSEVELSNDIVRDYLENYYEGYSKKWPHPGDVYQNKPAVLEWRADGAEYYTVTVAHDLAFRTAEKHVTAETTLTVKNLLPDTLYYWQVKATYADGEKTSPVFTFRTEDAPRLLDIEGVSNTRDLGGKIGAGGKRVAYGKLYRSALLDNVTQEGIYALKRLGVKTDLDLRAGGEGGAGESSPLGADVNYIHISGAAYTYPDLGFNDPANREQFRKEMAQIVDPDNYPILFHCSVGRDRTGTLAIVIYALLGVSEEEIIKDYELSFLSASGTQDGGDANTMVNSCKMVIGYLYGFGGATLQESAESFLLYLGIGRQQIEDFQQMMLV